MNNYFKIDQLVSNCDCIIKFVSNQNDLPEDEFNSSIIDNCNQLIESAEFIEKIALDFTFETIATNGFIVYLKIITAYTEKIVKQIKKHKKIDRNLIKLFKIVMTYKNLIIFVHKMIVEETKGSSTIKNPLHMNTCILSSKEIYDLTHSNGDVQHISLGFYPGFWLPKKIQKFLKFCNFLFAFNYRLPFSMTSLFSDKRLGKLCYQAFKNSTKSYPFSIWHQTEGFFVSKFLNNLRNIRIPVKSINVRIPKQYRFRLHYTGKIFDFHNMSDEEIESYFNDKEEQERHNSKGKRHRNGRRILCRFSYIESREKVIESLEKIEKIKNTTQKYKKMTHQSARRTVRNTSIETKVQEPNNQVEQLNIYKTNDLVANKLNLKIKKNKFPKYDGPKYEESNSDDFNDVPLQNGSAEKNKFDLNKDGKIVLYLHGGGFWTQGPNSCELFLRNIINHLGGIPMIGVHYSLTVPHPVAMQEILDVYLWLLSNGEDVRQMLGFNPKKIVLFGDSAGGYLTVCLSIVLNEINKTFNLNIPLPISMLLCYPIVNLKVITPSRSLSCLEPLVAYHSVLIVMALHATNLSSNGDFKKIKDNEIFKRIEESNRNVPVDEEFQKKYPIEKNWNNDSAPWYSCDYQTFKSRSDYISYMYENSGYVNLINYEKLDDLKEIDLYTVSGELDFLVDDAIEISRRWKGNVSLDIIENLMHGYFYFSFISGICEDASKLSLYRLQEACGLL